MANIPKELGRKRSQNLLDVMTDLVSTRTSMTGYELAMMFMDLPSYDMDETVLVTMLNAPRPQAGGSRLACALFGQHAAKHARAIQRDNTPHDDRTEFLQR